MVYGCRCRWVCDRFEARERIVWGVFIPREQRRTGEGAGSSSGPGRCSRGQSTPASVLAVTPTRSIDEQLAVAMLVSISDGFCLEGLLGAIFFRESDILAAGVVLVRVDESSPSCG